MWPATHSSDEKDVSSHDTPSPYTSAYATEDSATDFSVTNHVMSSPIQAEHPDRVPVPEKLDRVPSVQSTRMVAESLNRLAST